MNEDDLGLEVVFFLNLPVTVGCLSCFTSIYIPSMFNFLAVDAFVMYCARESSFLLILKCDGYLAIPVF